jgi:hypothetical protein
VWTTILIYRGRRYRLQRIPFDEQVCVNACVYVFVCAHARVCAAARNVREGGPLEPCMLAQVEAMLRSGHVDAAEYLLEHTTDPEARCVVCVYVCVYVCVRVVDSGVQRGQAYEISP